MTRSNLLLTAIHLAGNLVLLWSGYYWLGLPESRAATLLWSAAVAVLWAALACWLHGSTFVYFAGQQQDLRGAFRTGLRNLPAILAAVLLAVAVYWLLARWADASNDAGFRLASWLTLKFRKPVKPTTVLRTFAFAFGVLRWVVLPVLLLPLVSAVASHGWRGFGRIGRLAGKRLYWLEVPALLLTALWMPFQLTAWVPEVGSFTTEIVSFAARFLAGYLLFVAAWLLLAFLTSVGKPVLSHERTAVSP